MPKGYWVTTYRSIKDPDKLAAYAKLAPVALAPFGAKYIVRGAAVAASEAGIRTCTHKSGLWERRSMSASLRKRPNCCAAAK
jgi:uncharacterized protein (DUF1330 family)